MQNYLQNKKKMLARSRNIAHLALNQQNYIIFFWYFYAKWKTVVHIIYIYLPFKVKADPLSKRSLL